MASAPLRTPVASIDHGDGEDLDPRIQIELEKLNSSTDVINKLELDLEEARSQFRLLLNDSTRRLDEVSRDLGSCVEKSRRYYDARMQARKALLEAQHAAARFEKASSAHEAAKEMVTLAEEGFKEKGSVTAGGQFDQAWQEMLNHATNKVNESEKEKMESAKDHRDKSKAYQKSEQRVQELQKSLKKSINKSRPYFELKAKFNQMLDDQKRQVQLIEETIQMTKLGYAQSLKELEKISEEIHERRVKEKTLRAELGDRGQGVGAESPEPPRDSLEVSHGEKEQSGIRPEELGLEMKRSGANGQQQQQPPSLLVTQNNEPRCTSLPIAAAATTSGCNSPAQKEPLPTNSSTSNTTTASSSNATSPLRSPSYEQLREDEDFQIVDIRGEEDARTPCTHWQPQSLPGCLKVKHLEVVQQQELDAASDSESLASMELLDDDQIEQLMKDASLLHSADRPPSSAEEPEPARKEDS